MLIVLATAKLGNGVPDAGLEVLRAMINASRAEEGCISYAYATDVLDPTILHVVEKWKDDEALAFHFATPHMAEFRKALATLDLKITEIAKYRSDDGNPI